MFRSFVLLKRKQDKILHFPNAGTSNFDQLLRSESKLKLDQELWLLYRNYEHNTKETLERINSKFTAAKDLENFIRNKKIMKNALLFPIGFSTTKFAVYRRDLDLCLLDDENNLASTEILGNINDHKNSSNTLNRLGSILGNRYERKDFTKIKVEQSPKMSILRLFDYAVDGQSIDVHITFRNFNGIRNTNLLKSFCEADERFPALALLISKWANEAGISHTSSGVLSSYAISLLVYHFLQLYITKSPSNNLQSLIRNDFNSCVNGELKLSDIDQNMQTLADLFIQFYHHYSNKVDFTKDIISTPKIPKQNFSVPNIGPYSLYIEDPFSGTNVTQNVKTKKAVESIVEKFREVYFKINELHGNPEEKNPTFVSCTEPNIIRQTKLNYADSAKPASIETLDRELWIYFHNNWQTEDQLKTKRQAIKDLESSFRSHFKRQLKLIPFGSTVTNFGTIKCDLDLCALEDRRQINDEHPPGIKRRKNDSNKILYSLAHLFKKYYSKQFLNIIHIRHAKVPILRIQDYSVGAMKFNIDINGDNSLVSIRDTHLLKSYCELDERFSALTLIIKQWAIAAGIHNASKGFLASFAVSLLVLHFFQYGVTPAVLPNLQTTMPQVFDKNIPIGNLKGIKSSEVPHYEKNNLSLAELLLQFFDYYSNNFDFDRDAVSILNGSKIHKPNATSSKNRNSIFIYGPYSNVNVAASLTDINCKVIIKEINESNAKLKILQSFSSICH